MERSSWPLPNLRPCKHCPSARQRLGGCCRELHTPTLGPGVLLASSCPPHPTTTFPFHGPGQGSEGHQIPARQAARFCLANRLQGPFKQIVTLSSHS